VLALATAIYGPTSTLLSIKAAARLAGYQLDIVRLPWMTRHSLAEAGDRLPSQGGDGIICITPTPGRPMPCSRQSRAFRCSWWRAAGRLPSVAGTRRGTPPPPPNTCSPRSHDRVARGRAVRLVGPSVVGFDDLPEPLTSLPRSPQSGRSSTRWASWRSTPARPDRRALHRRTPPRRRPRGSSSRGARLPARERGSGPRAGWENNSALAWLDTYQGSGLRQRHRAIRGAATPTSITTIGLSHSA
jgi:hypothetical protein